LFSSLQTNVPEDEKIHEKYHQQTLTTIPQFRGWTTEDAMAISDWAEHNGRIIHLTPQHRMMESVYVLEVLNKMEKDFGIPLSDYKTHHLYLAVYESKIVGLTAVQETVQAKRKNGTEAVVRLGVQRLYVRPSYRMKGIGKAILKTIAIFHDRQTGEMLDLRKDFAFSTPTDDGKRFIKKVTGSDNYFVYFP